MSSIRSSYIFENHPGSRLIRLLVQTYQVDVEWLHQVLSHTVWWNIFDPVDFRIFTSNSIGNPYLVGILLLRLLYKDSSQVSQLLYLVNLTKTIPIDLHCDQTSVLYQV